MLKPSSHSTSNPSVRYVWFDLVRGLSALAVCAGHLRGAMFVDLSQTASPPVWVRAFYAATSLGPEAVMVFFVLSGFFVGGAVLRRGSDFRWAGYATARLTRLWIVLLPALALTFAVDLATGAAAPDVLAGRAYDTLNSGPTSTYTTGWATLAGNLVFLQTLAVPVFGTNEPLWSLANEFWYYVAFPLLAVLAWAGLGKRSVAEGVAAVVALGAIGWLFGEPLWLGFVIWLLGAGLWSVQRWLPDWPLAVRIAAGALFAASLAVTRLPVGLPDSAYSDVLVGVAFAVFAATLVHDRGTAERYPRLAGASLWLSEISYSLYLSHFPLVILLYSLVYRHGQQPVSGLGLLTYGLTLGTLVALGYGFWWLFERRTPALRRAADRVLSRPEPSPARPITG